MERFYVAVLLSCMCPDELEVDAQYGGGLSELFANVLESVVTLKDQLGTVRLGCSDGLNELLDGDVSGGQGVEPVGDPLTGKDV